MICCRWSTCAERRTCKLLGYAIAVDVSAADLLSSRDAYRIYEPQTSVIVGSWLLHDPLTWILKVPVVPQTLDKDVDALQTQKRQLPDGRGAAWRCLSRSRLAVQAHFRRPMQLCCPRQLGYVQPPQPIFPFKAQFDGMTASGGIWSSRVATMERRTKNTTLPASDPERLRLSYAVTIDLEHW